MATRTSGRVTTRSPRSWLFVPGDRPERFAKAAASGAHAVVCDLEDGVLPEHKVMARRAVCGWIEQGGAAFVRVNAVDTEWSDEDIDAVAPLEAVRGVLIPKCETPDAAEYVRGRLGHDQAVIALVETAIGVSRALELASAKGVSRLGFGSYDYAADLGIAHTPAALLHARSTLVMASRAAGIDTPLDGVTATFRDPQECREDATRSRELGFGGKMCIHPTQVEVVNEAFAPTSSECDWAGRVVELAANVEHGALNLDGQVIDGPSVEQAKKILAEARASPSEHQQRLRAILAHTTRSSVQLDDSGSGADGVFNVGD